MVLDGAFYMIASNASDSEFWKSQMAVRGNFEKVVFFKNGNKCKRNSNIQNICCGFEEQEVFRPNSSAV
jgi:hypothetical protein